MLIKNNNYYNNNSKQQLFVLQNAELQHKEVCPLLKSEEVLDFRALGMLF